jgi:hypothetical protein
MPVEIRELNIKAYVDDSAKLKNEQATTDKKLTDSIESIVAVCVEQVLEILKNREER